MDKKLERVAVNEVDLKNMQLIKEKLYEVLVVPYNKISEIIAESIKYYEDCFYPKKEAIDFLIEEYQSKLRNRTYEKKIIVGFKDACEKASGKEGLDFIDYISTEMTPLMSLYCSVEHIGKNENYVKQIIEMLTAYEIIRRLKNKPKENAGISVLQWGAIFYYADEAGYFGEDFTVNSKIGDFIKKHSVDTTVKSLRAKYYTAIQRINKKDDYPIDKLNEILPFIKANYPKAATQVRKDIEILEEKALDM